MDIIFWLLLYWSVLIVFCILWMRSRIRKSKEHSKQQAVYRAIDKNAELSYKAVDAKSIKTVEKYLSQAEANYQEVSHFANSVNREWLESDIEDIRKEIENRKREEWETQASEILRKLFDVYYMIIEYDFENVDRAYKAKTQCLKYWDQYWKSVYECEVQIAPRHFFDMYVYEEDHSFDSKENLQRRLEQAINEMKPEYLRKMSIYNAILNVVYEANSIMRCDLLKTNIPNATAKEVGYCYKELIKKYKLVEVKLGNRYFVSLSDKELEKRNCKSCAVDSGKEVE